MSSVTGLLVCFVGISILIAFILIAASIRIVPEYQRMDVYRLGRYIGEKGPGIVLLIPLVDRGMLKNVGSVEKMPAQRLVGALGQARTTIYNDGKALLANGEEWDAISQTPLSAGQRVRVVRMILEVEKE